MSDAVERHLRLAGAGHVIEARSGCGRNSAVTSVVDAVARRGRRRAHRTSAWCRRRVKFDAAAGEHLPVVFEVVADLDEHAVFQQRLQRVERVALGDLVRRKAWPANRSLVPPSLRLAVAERHVAGFVRRTASEGRKARPASDRGCWSRSRARPRRCPCARDPGLQAVERARLFRISLRSNFACRNAARRRAAERHRRERRLRVAPGVCTVARGHIERAIAA